MNHITRSGHLIDLSSDYYEGDRLGALAFDSTDLQETVPIFCQSGSRIYRSDNKIFRLFMDEKIVIFDEMLNEEEFDKWIEMQRPEDKIPKKYQSEA